MDHLHPNDGPRKEYLEEAENLDQINHEILEFGRSGKRSILDIYHELKKEDSSLKFWTNAAILIAVLSFIISAVILGEMFGLYDFLPNFDVLGQAACCGSSSGCCPSAQQDSAAGFTNLITILGPLFLVGLTYIVGATGLKRLELYDQEFRENKKERREEFDEFKKEIGEQLLIGSEKAFNQAQKAASEEVTAQKKQTEQVEANIKAAREEIKRLRSDYSWIFDNEETRELYRDDAIQSMGELHTALTDLFRKEKAADAKKLINQYFADNETFDTKLRGPANDFFNVATQLAQADLKPLAYVVSEAGLKIFPDNLDLLANTVKFALDRGRTDRARELLKKIDNIPPETKNWRLWVFAADTIETIGEPADFEDYCWKYARRFVGNSDEPLENMPADAPTEKMFAKLARHYQSYGKLSEARRVCQIAQKIIPRTPQISGILGDVLLELQDYVAAATVSQKSIADDSGDSSNINISSRYMTIAAANEAMFFDNTANSILHARKALANYGACRASDDFIPAYLRQIPLRVNAICMRLFDLGQSADDIRDMVPKNIREYMPDLGGTTEDETDDNDSFDTLARKTLMVAKAISTEPDNTWESRLQPLADEIKTSDHRDQMKAMIAQAADHFADEPDQETYVRVLRKLLGMI